MKSGGSGADAEQKNFEIREGKRCALLGGVRQFFRRKIAKRWRAEREANAVH